MQSTPITPGCHVKLSANGGNRAMRARAPRRSVVPMEPAAARALSIGLTLLAGLAAAPAHAAPALTTIATFTGANGSAPFGGVVADATGNLYGTTVRGGGGSGPAGTVFQIPKTGGGYGPLTTLATFNATGGVYPNGNTPVSALLIDAAGNLLGTAYGGGYGNNGAVGTVFEVPKTGSGYGPLTTIAAFGNPYGAFPQAGLTADAAGNLFGTTGSSVFEIPKTGGTYGTPSLIVNGIPINGNPSAGVIIDASGNLFGTTSGGVYGQGNVFEIPKTGGTYGTPSILGDFNNLNGSNPLGGLTADASGNLFGTTRGNAGAGTVFEIPKTVGGYGALTILAYFNGTISGGFPSTGVIVDAAGNLFGTANFGGPGGDQAGVVWELPNTGSGFGPFVNIATFDGTNGASPTGLLLADASGNLFGTTSGGGEFNDGTVFEITGSGFQVAADLPEPISILAFGAGTAALAMIRRRRRQASRGVGRQV